MPEQASGPAALSALRRKFVFTNMLFVAIVLVVMCVVMVATTSHQRATEVYDALDRRISMGVEQHGGTHPSFDDWRMGQMGEAMPGARFDGDFPPEPPDGAMPQYQDGQEAARDTQLDQGGSYIATAVFLADAEGAIVAAVDDPLDLDEEVLDAAVADVVARIAQGADARGHLTASNLYFEAKEYADGIYQVAFVSGDYVDQSVSTLLRMLVIIGIAILVAFFAMSLFLSRWALGPVRRAWDQQQQFIADASHELKTPLTVILANNSIVMSDPTATVGSQMQWIESTEAEAHLMQGLVNDMLYLARNDATADQAMGSESVCISDLARSVALQFESVAFERGVLIEDDIADGVVVTGDRANLQRLLGTLVDNACKYVNEGGGVKVSLRREGQSCRLDVNNTGAPIPADDLPHLFDRFYRADKSRERSTGGFGLGLAIAHSIVEAHRGTIEVTSDAAHGTTFTVKLPLAG